MSKNLKHVKLFEQFSIEDNELEDNELEDNEPESLDKYPYYDRTNIPYTEDLTLIVPEYIAENGDFIVWDFREMPAVGLLNNDEGFNLLSGSSFSNDGDIVKMSLKKGDCFLYLNQGEYKGLTAKELALMEIGIDYTYISSRDFSYASEAGDGNGIIFTILSNPNELIRAEAYNVFYVENIN